MKDLAPGFEVEAWSIPDHVPEAIRRKDGRGRSYIAATQWHPEFHKYGSTETVDDTPILRRLPVGLRDREGEPAGAAAHRAGPHPQPRGAAAAAGAADALGRR